MSKTVKVEFNQFQNRLLGHLAVARRLITKKQLDDAVAEQKRRRERGETALLGRILLERKWISDFDLSELLRLQSELNRQREQCAWAQLSIGDMLVAVGDAKKAILEYKKVADIYGDHREPCAQALKKIGDCYNRLGEKTRALKIYRDLIEKYHIE